MEILAKRVLYKKLKSRPRKTISVDSGYGRIKTIPVPRNNEEWFNAMTEFPAQRYFEALVRDFNAVFPEINMDIVDQELEKINDFIERTKGQDIRSAMKFTIYDTDPVIAYVRIKNGYFKKHRTGLAFNSIESVAYARYFLFKSWLIDQRTKISESQNNEVGFVKNVSESSEKGDFFQENESDKQNSNFDEISHGSEKPKRFSHYEIAMVYFLNGEKNTDNNAQAIAEHHGYSSATSGQKLRAWFKKLFNDESSIIYKKGAQQNLENVKPFLNEEGVKKATKILRDIKLYKKT